MVGRRKLAAAFGNLALLGASVLISYLVFGAVWLRFGPALLPSLTNLFPVAATIWWQTSAPDPVHQDYIAIAGDSNAVGVGDWQAGRQSVDQPSSVSDVVHAKLGKPVLTIGQSGAGTPEGLVLFPTRVLNADRCLIFDRPRQPAQIVLLFYEGNDLNNNVSYIKRTLRTTPDDPALAARTARHLRDDYAVTGFGTCARYFYAGLHSMLRTQLGSRAPPAEAQRPNWVTIDGATVEVPANLQGPALELSDAELRAAVVVAESSLEWVREAMPATPVTVVFMPSVLTTYDLADAFVSIQTYQRGTHIHSSARVAATSDFICDSLRDAALRQGARFVDIRPVLRRAARSEALHGPHDWKHFNRKGYTLVAEAVAAFLAGDKAAAAPCADLAGLATSANP